MTETPTRRCGIAQPHRDHFWIVGRRYTQCPGVGRSATAGAIEAAVTVSEYTVSLLPERHPDYRNGRILVRRIGEEQWILEHSGYFINIDGEWSPGQGSAAWFDLDTALHLAREAAPTIRVNGYTVAAVLARAERPA